MPKKILTERPQRGCVLTEKSEILQEALKYLSPVRVEHCGIRQGEKEEFICNCVAQLLADDKAQQKPTGEILQLIRERLQGENTLPGWLYTYKGVRFNDMKQNQGRKLQETRRQWMLSMIEEFKAQGD